MNRTELKELVLAHMTREQVQEFGDMRLKATWQSAYDYIIASECNSSDKQEPCRVATDNDNQPISSGLSAITLLKTATAIAREECQRIALDYNVLSVVLHHCFVVWFILCYLFYRCVPIIQTAVTRLQQTRATLDVSITSRFIPTVRAHYPKIVRA